MVRINILDRSDKAITIEFMGYINLTEFGVFRDCLREYAEEGITEVCIMAREVMYINPWLKEDMTALGQLGMMLRFQKLSFYLRYSLKIWGLEAWIDEQN